MDFLEIQKYKTGEKLVELCKIMNDESDAIQYKTVGCIRSTHGINPEVYVHQKVYNLPALVFKNRELAQKFYEKHKEWIDLYCAVLSEEERAKFFY